MDPRQHGYPPQHRQLQNAQRQHQRFSWQDPPNTPPEETQAQFQAQQRQQQPAQLNVNVNSNNRGFSYAQTPTEHRAFHYTSDEPLPQTPHTPAGYPQQSAYHQQQQAAPIQPQYPQDVKPPAYDDEMAKSPLSPHNGTHPFSPMSPVAERPRIQTNITPQIQTNMTSQSRHARQRSELSPINTNLSTMAAPPPVPALPAGPLPQKGSMTPISPTAIKREPADYPLPISPTAHSGPIAEPYSPHGFDRNPQHTIFSPHAAHGPNGLDFALHQPGQIAHPNMETSEKSPHSKSWKHSLFSCTPAPIDCLTGLTCPCILYGRTSYRLSQRSAKKDPTDLLSYKATNSRCAMMGAACGLWWLFPMMQRMKIRHTYKIEGSCLGDVVRGCCCCCCVAVANEREVREREEKSRRLAGPASSDVYSRAGGMVYAPQN